MKKKSREGYEKKVGALFRIFEPKSIAIVGASPIPGKIGNMALKNVISGEFKGKIYPVNPNYEEIAGLKCYSSLKEIEASVDLAILAVPASIVPRVLNDCGEKGVAGAVVFASGFSEYSEEGHRLEEDILTIARRYGTRIIGPNCMGFFNAEISLNATFSPGITKDIIQRGHAAFISQSGALSTAVLLEAAAQGIYFEKFFTLGNKVDIDESDVLTYLNHKENIKLISIYMEGLKRNRGRDFIDAAREVTKTKLVIVLKSGKTEAGSRATKSHTGSLAGVHAIYQAAFKQANIIEVNTLGELLSFVRVASTKYPLKGERVAIISGSGGAAVLATDGLESGGIRVLPMPEEIKSGLKEVLATPRYASINNPMDLTFEGASPRNFKNAIEYLTSNDVADVFLVCLIASRTLEVAHTLMEIIDDIKRPIIVSWTGKNTKEVIEAADMLNKNGIPVFDFPAEAGFYLGKYITYLQRRKDV